MMINKNRFRVSNDKKVLHKIGKRWVTVSALTLALLGGAAAASTVTTHADTNAPKSAAVTTNLNKALNNSKPASSSAAPAKASNATKPSTVQSQAGRMYRGLMLNANRPSAKSSANAMNTLNLGTKSEQARGWNFVQHGINNNDYARVNQPKFSAVNNSASNDRTTSVSSTNAKVSTAPNNSVSTSAKSSFNSAYQSYMAQMSGVDAQVASANASAVNDSNKTKQNNKKALLKDDNATTQPSDNHWIYDNGKYISSMPSADDISDGTYDGLTYKCDKTLKAVEFTGGTCNKSDVSDFFGGSWPYAPYVAMDPNIKSVKFDNNINMSRVTNMNEMFMSDSGIVNLNLGNSFDTSKVTDMSQMFWQNTALQHLDLGNSFNTSKVTDMSEMFDGDSALQSLDVSHFNTNDVTKMNNMFGGNSALQSLDVSHFNTSKVTDMSDMFDSDSALQSLDVSHFNTSKVTDMSNMFDGDSALQSLTLPSTFDTRTAVASAFIYPTTNIFGSNKSLQSLTIQSPNTQIDFNQAMYKQLPQKDANGKPYTLSTPNDFSQGNVGTFTVNKNPMPTTVNATINYEINGSGNPISTKSVTGAIGTNAIDYIRQNVPNNYHLIAGGNYNNGNNGYNYWNGNDTIDVAIAPNTMTQHINYIWYGQNKGTTTINGAYNTPGSANGTGLNPGWHVNNDGSQNFTFNGNTQNVDILPNTVTDHIHYTGDGADTWTNVSGNDYRTGVNGTVTFTNSYHPGMPSNYHIGNNQTFNFDGGNHDVTVISNYDFNSASNQANADVNGIPNINSAKANSANSVANSDANSASADNNSGAINNQKAQENDWYNQVQNDINNANAAKAQAQNYAGAVANDSRARNESQAKADLVNANYYANTAKDAANAANGIINGMNDNVSPDVYNFGSASNIVNGLHSASADETNANNIHNTMAHNMQSLNADTNSAAVSNENNTDTSAYNQITNLNTQMNSNNNAAAADIAKVRQDMTARNAAATKADLNKAQADNQKAHDNATQIVQQANKMTDTNPAASAYNFASASSVADKLSASADTSAANATHTKVDNYMPNINADTNIPDVEKEVNSDNTDFNTMNNDISKLNAANDTVKADINKVNADAKQPSTQQNAAQTISDLQQAQKDNSVAQGIANQVNNDAASVVSAGLVTTPNVYNFNSAVNAANGLRSASVDSSSASSVNTVASSYAASASEDTNSGAITSQNDKDKGIYNQMASLSGQVESANNLAKSYATDVDNASKASNAASASADLSNANSANTAASGFNNQLNNIAKQMSDNVKPTVTDTIAFYTKRSDDANVLVSKKSITGYLGSSDNISGDIPANYLLAHQASDMVQLKTQNEISKITLIEHNTDNQRTTNQYVPVPVEPESASTTIDYVVSDNNATNNKSTVASSTFSGNDYRATDAGNNSYNISHPTNTNASGTNADGLPAGYHIINGQNMSIPYDNNAKGKHTVKIIGNQHNADKKDNRPSKTMPTDIPASDVLKVHRVEFIKGNPKSVGSDVEYIGVSGRTGEKNTFAPDTFKPAGFYSITNEPSQSVVITANGTNPSEITFNYDASIEHNVTVHYINQDKKTLATETLSEPTAYQGNIYQYPGLAMPNGYHFVKASDNGKAITGNAKDIGYTVTPNNQDINIYVQGDSFVPGINPDGTPNTPDNKSASDAAKDTTDTPANPWNSNNSNSPFNPTNPNSPYNPNSPFDPSNPNSPLNPKNNGGNTNPNDPNSQYDPKNPKSILNPSNPNSPLNPSHKGSPMTPSDNPYDPNETKPSDHAKRGDKNDAGGNTWNPDTPGSPLNPKNPDSPLYPHNPANPDNPLTPDNQKHHTKPANGKGNKVPSTHLPSGKPSKPSDSSDVPSKPSKTGKKTDGHATEGGKTNPNYNPPVPSDSTSTDTHKNGNNTTPNQPDSNKANGKSTDKPDSPQDAKNTFYVTINDFDSKGNLVRSYQKRVVEEGLVGNTFQLSPDTYTTNGYTKDSADKNYTGYFGADALLAGDDKTPQNSIVWNYDAAPQTATVRFVDQHGAQVLAPTTINGHTDSDVSDVTAQATVPNGYHKISGKNYDYQFSGINNPTNNPVQTYVVQGNVIMLNPTVVTNYCENGGKIDSTKTHVLSPINTNVGDTVKIADPFDYEESNYDDPNSTWNYLVVPGNTNPTHTFNYYAPRAGNLVIDYYDIDTGHQVGSDVYTAQQMEAAPYNVDWYVGNQIDLGVADSHDGNVDVLKAPTGYRIVEAHNNKKEDQQHYNYPLNSGKIVVTLVPPKQNGAGAVLRVGLMLMARPVKPASNTNQPASSASAKPSSASVAPSSKASSASSSASVAPSSASVAPSSKASSASSSVAPSSASSVASSSTPQSSSASAPARQFINHGYVAPNNNETPSDTETQPSDITPVKPAVHKHTTTPSEPAKPVTKPSDNIVNKNAGKAETQPVAEITRRTAEVQRAAESHMARGNFTRPYDTVRREANSHMIGQMIQPTVHVHASRVNGARHETAQHKLPQTDEAKAAGLMSAASIMAALGLAGADVDRKRRRN